MPNRCEPGLAEKNAAASGHWAASCLASHACRLPCVNAHAGRTETHQANPRLAGAIGLLTADSGGTAQHRCSTCQTLRTFACGMRSTAISGINALHSCLGAPPNPPSRGPVTAAQPPPNPPVAAHSPGHQSGLSSIHPTRLTRFLLQSALWARLFRPLGALQTHLSSEIPRPTQPPLPAQTISSQVQPTAH